MSILLKSHKIFGFSFVYFTISAALQAPKSDSFSIRLETDNHSRNERFEDLFSEIILREVLFHDIIIHHDYASGDFVDCIMKNTNAKKEIRIKSRNGIITVKSSHPATTVIVNYDKLKESEKPLSNVVRRTAIHVISLKEPLKFDDFYLDFLKSSDIIILICQKSYGSCKGAFHNGSRINALDPLFLKSSKFFKKVLLTFIIEVFDYRVRLYEICFYCGAAAERLIQKHQIDLSTDNSSHDIELYSKLMEFSRFTTWNFNLHVFKVATSLDEMNFGCQNQKETVKISNDESVVLCEAFVSLEGHMLLEIQKRLNFKAKLLYFRSDEIHGNDYEKIISITNERRADMAVGGISVSFARTEMVLFSFLVSEDPSKVIYSIQAGFLKDGLKLLYVFSISTWIAIAFTLVAQSVVVYITNLNTGRENKFSDILWVVGLMLTEQSIQVNWKSLGGRVLILWLLCCINISTLFKAQLTSYITKPPEEPLSNMDELVGDGYRLDLITANTQFILEMLNGSSDKSLLKLSHRVNPRTDWCTTVKDMIGKKQMLIDEVDTIYKEINRNCRKLITIDDMLSLRLTRDNIFPSTHAWAFPKKAPYYKIINNQIMLYHQNGLQKKWGESLQVPPGNHSVYFDGVAMIDKSNSSPQKRKFYGQFVLWFFGIGLSFFCFIAEIAFNIFQKIKDKRKRIKRHFFMN